MKITWSYSVKVNGAEVSKHGGKMSAERKAKKVGGVVVKRDWREELDLFGADEDENDGKITVESASCGMSNTTYHRRCGRGQKNWWLKSEDGFIDLGKYGYQRGDRAFEAELELEDGEYTMGAGPFKYGIRERFTVSGGKITEHYICR